MKRKETIEKMTLEKIAAEYKPQPFNVDNIQLPDSLLALTEAIAENTHDCWAQARLSQGWSYGPMRDDITKKHPDLIPYSQLKEEDKEYDRVTAMNAIKLIVAMGYSIQKI